MVRKKTTNARLFLHFLAIRAPFTIWVYLNSSNLDFVILFPRPRYFYFYVTVCVITFFICRNYNTTAIVFVGLRFCVWSVYLCLFIGGFI